MSFGEIYAGLQTEEVRGVLEGGERTIDWKGDLQMSDDLGFGSL